jgi:hypothetical protein
MEVTPKEIDELVETIRKAWYDRTTMIQAYRAKIFAVSRKAVKAEDVEVLSSILRCLDEMGKHKPTFKDLCQLSRSSGLLLYGRTSALGGILGFTATDFAAPLWQFVAISSAEQNAPRVA